MAYDGLLIRKQINELNKILLNERITRILQPDSKTVLMLFKKNNKEIVLSISINPNFPVIRLINEKDYSNLNPLAFCMLLRKYINNGIVVNISQIDGHGDTNSLERIIDINIKNTTEGGDIKNFHLIIELLGRYSNVVICDDNYIIIDVLYKNYNSQTKLRELIPKINYNTNDLTKKNSLIDITYEKFIEHLYDNYKVDLLNNVKLDLINIFIQSFYGLSKSYIINIFNKYNTNENEILELFNKSKQALNIINNKLLINEYNEILNNINQINSNSNLEYKIYYENNKPIDFHIFSLSQYTNYKSYSNINELINEYITQKFNYSVESNDKTLLKNNLHLLLAKLNKKIDIYESEINNNSNFDKYKVYADLINTYGYNNEMINNNILICPNFYDNNSIIEIPIDTSLSIPKNAEKYYQKYNKSKRAIIANKNLLEDTHNKINHLLSIDETLNFSLDAYDLLIIKEELNKYFYKKNINTNPKTKKKKNINFNIKKYKSSSGVDIYLGKNNLQNEYLTFDLANSTDTWFHIKNATGSHVIIKKPYTELDMKTIEEAASLCAYYSSLKNDTKVTVDYTLKKELKKVKGAPPGFCIYHKYYSINVIPSNNLKEIK